MKRQIIKPHQLRGARALLRWKRETLAHHAGVSLDVIKNFECEKSKITLLSLANIIDALMEHGILFAHTHGVILMKGREPAAQLPNLSSVIERHDPSAPILPAQLIAARAMLNWTQHDLSKASSVSIFTIANFEKDFGHTSEQTFRKIVTTLLAHGVFFMGIDGVFLIDAEEAAKGPWKTLMMSARVHRSQAVKAEPICPAVVMQVEQKTL